MSCDLVVVLGGSAGNRAGDWGLCDEMGGKRYSRGVLRRWRSELAIGVTSGNRWEQKTMWGRD